MKLKTKISLILILILSMFILIGAVSAQTNTTTVATADTSNINTININDTSNSAINHDNNNYYQETNDTTDTNTQNKLLSTGSNNDVSVISQTDETNNLQSEVDTVYISPDGSGTGETIDSPTTWSNAITSVNEGGTINFASGTYTDIVNQTISKNITLYHDIGKGEAIINANGTGYIFKLNNTNLVVNGLKLVNATGYDSNKGGAIYLENGNLTLCNSSFINNTANRGGAIYLGTGDLTLCNSSFINNIASYGGAILLYTCNLIVSNSSFINNIASFGGAISLSNEGNVTVSNSSFINNSANECGGAIFLGTVNVTVSNSSFINNTARDGGAIYSSGDLNVDKSKFNNNNAKTKGGAIFMYNGILLDSTFYNNSAENGGGIYIYTKDDVISSSFINNTAKTNGGAIYNYNGNMNVTGSTLINNTANYHGGAIYLEDGNVTITGSTLLNNSGTNLGGAICLMDSNMNVTNTTLFNNSANEGGAIYVYEGNVNVAYSTLFNNSASEGGAIYLVGNGNVINCTLFNNTADEDGAAICVIEGNAEVIGSNFYNNTAKYGGAIYTITNIYIINSTFNNNNATKSGGAIYSSKNLDVNNSKFTNNSASEGGAIYLASNGNVINCTLFNNSAKGYGGAIRVIRGNLNVTNSTLINNTGDYGGAIYVASGNVNVTGSTFNNNNASYQSGAIHVALGNLNVTSSTIINNTGYYGGAIFATNVNVTGSILINNTENANNNAIYFASLCDASYNWWGNNTPFNSGNKLIYNSSNNDYITPNNWVILTSTCNDGIISTFLNKINNTSGVVSNLPTDLTIPERSTIYNVSNIYNNPGNTQSTSIYFGDEDTISVTVDNQTLALTATPFKGFYVNGSTTDTIVDGTLKHPFHNITSALEYANLVKHEVTIYITNGIYHDINMTISNNVNISSYNHEDVVIDAEGKGYIFYITNNVNVGVNGLEFINGTGYGRDYYTDGGVISIDKGNLNVADSKFINNHVTNNGGAIYNHNGGDVNVTNSIFINNYASYDGGAIFDLDGAVNVTNSTFINHKAEVGGIICAYNADLYIADCLIVNSTSYNNFGGAIHETNRDLNIINSTFINNSAPYMGGAISTESSVNFNIINSQFINNTAPRGGDGGAIYANIEDKGHIINSTFINNTAGNNGGAIFLKNGIVECSTFINNTAGSDGGAIFFIDGIVKGSVFLNNTATEYGQAIYYDDSCNASYNWWGNNTPFTSPEKNNLIRQFINWDNIPFITPDNWVIMGLNLNPTSITTMGSSVLVASLNQVNTSTGEVSSLPSTIILPNRTVTFNANGGSLNPTQDSIIGIATSTFTPSDSGTYILTATIDNQTLSTNIKVTKDTSIINTNLTSFENGTVLINIIDEGSIVDTGSVNIFYNNTAIGTNYVKDGVANISIKDLKPGNYTVIVFYFGKDSFTSTSKTLNLTVLAKPIIDNSTFLTGDNLSKTYGIEGNYTGKLVDINGKPIIGAHISINLTRLSTNQSKVYWATTDTNGEYQLPINLGLGSYSATSFFEGNSKYSPSNNVTNSIIVVKPNLTTTTLTADAFNHTVNAGLNFTGKLFNNLTLTPIAGQHIAIKLTRLSNNQSKVYWATTDINGEYQLVINLGIGSYKAECSYAGTSEYSSSSANASLTVTS